MRRIEIWFNNGLFRAFPNVQESTIRKDGEFLIFVFGHDHVANINLSNVNFIEEFMEAGEES